MKTRNFVKTLVLILMTSLMMLLVIGCSSSPNQDTQNASSQAQEASGPADDNSQDSKLIASFIKDFNDSAQRKLESTDPIVLDDTRASNMANQYFASVLKEPNNGGVHSIVSYPRSDADKSHPVNYLCVSIEDISGIKAITVCGMFGNNESMVDAFCSAFLLLSKDATQADSDQLEKDETFLYGGKSGEIAGIQYEVSGFGGCHTISLTAPIENLNL